MMARKSSLEEEKKINDERNVFFCYHLDEDRIEENEQEEILKVH